ncbi:hypothetical protein HMPREF1624_03708 [Sporothrix schenckii ATCC 58251]|uniref:Uncharacterized protein n=1 Tax=Sporothrix schenckii (strain ATCC 58251 / de Perez 2211183) TaxID=1391915 RepID=U7PZF7_SPOS1|nr:hypothetical protein HMPREF1624_03708 [Sporothrix schenckii ATCC 58251]
MFLHSGASLHGHEYSNRPNRPPNQQLLPDPRRNRLLRSAFTSPNSASSSASTSSALSSSASAVSHPSVTSSSATAIPSLNASATSSPPSIVRSSTYSDGIRPARPLRPKPHLRHVSEGLLTSDRSLPPEPVVRFHDPPVVETGPITRSLSTNTPRLSTPSRPRARLPKAPEPMSEDEASFSASEASYASDPAPSSAASSKPSRRRRTPRKSTTFLLAHPAPKLSTKKHLLKRLRPTLLMQMQQLSADRRPRPVIDVYPSSLLAGNVAAPRFSKRFPRLFGINGELGLHDTILVQSEDYDSRLLGSESDDENDSFEHRALLAVLSPLRRGDQSEIALEDGSVWTTKALPTGSFDFVRVDEHGNTTTARWVSRNMSKPPPAVDAKCTTTGADDHAATAEHDCKFTFSIIDPQSRRHPILGTLTRTTLEILDTYTTVSPSASRYPPSRAWTPSPASHDADNSNDEELSHDDDAGQPSIAPSMLSNAKARTTLPVDAALKNFISISAVWVALQCGWGQTVGGHCPFPGTSNASGIKSATGSVRFVPDSSAGDATNAGDDTFKRGRRLSARYKTRSATLPSIDIPDRDVSPSVSPKAPGRTPIFPRKASSTGAAYIQRRKQMQLSDTSDSERPPAALIAPRRRSRAFSRLSGEFSSKVSSKVQSSPSPSEAPATPEVMLEEISPVPSSLYHHQQNSQQPNTSSRTTTAASSIAAAPVSSFTSPDLQQTQALLATQSLPRGGRSVSAYYATNPLAHAMPDDFTDAAHPDHLAMMQHHGPVDLSAAPIDIHRHNPNGMAWHHRPDSVMEKSSNNGGARWKRLGNWFKRLGNGGSANGVAH